MINETWRLAPWADALYACDERWWRLRGPSKQEFAGARYIGFGTSPGCSPCGVKSGDNSLRWCGYRLGAGANSGFQAVNLAAVSGARRIVLTGFDLSLKDGTHWHGDHTGPELSNPDARMLAGSARILDEKHAEFTKKGVEVVNASRVSALKRYPRMSISEALA